MKIAFIQSEVREFLSFMLLSANLKKAGHEVEVFIFNGENDLHELYLVKHFNPEIIGFSSSTVSFNNDLSTSKILKNITNAFVIFGGPHPTYNPNDTIQEDCVDAICIGEGLDAIVEFANDITRTDIQNIWVKNRLIKVEDVKPFFKLDPYLIHKNTIRPISNINDWPRPDYDLYYKKYPVLANKATKGVYLVRGCLFKCSFCYNPAFNQMYCGQEILQCMDVDKAINEIRWLKDNYGFQWLQFISDNMTMNKKWLREFMKAYREKMVDYDVYNVVMPMFNCQIERKEISPFLMNCRANQVTKEIVDILKESGCNRVDFGVEHGNDYIRNDVLKRNMSKEQIINAGRWFKKAGIRVQTTNIFGLPHEDFNKAWESVELNREFIPEISKACILQPFENTAVYNYAKEKGLLKGVACSGTTYQIGVEDKRSDESKIIIDDEKQVIRLSYLFDWFVKNRLPRWIGRIICSLPLDKLYRKYYVWVFKQQEGVYK